MFSLTNNLICDSHHISLNYSLPESVAHKVFTMKDLLRNLQMQHADHSDLVLAAWENKNGCDVFLIGKDNVRSHSDSLWILSPFVRSIIDSLGNIRDNTILLPDFSYEEIKTSLDIIDGARDGEFFFFNSTIKHLLESLGIDLKNTKTFNISNGDDWGEIENNNSENVPSNTVKVKREPVDEEGSIQEILLRDNLDLDFSDDEEETEEEDITVDELAPGMDLYVENKDVTEETAVAAGSEDRSEWQQQQKLQEVEELLIKENGGWKCKECGKIATARSSLRLHAETHVSGLSFPCNHCSKSFNTRGRLSRHRSENHQDKVKKRRTNL